MDATHIEIAQRMSDAGGTSGTGGHESRYRRVDSVLVDLPCGCQDVLYADGTICFEHAHAECGGNTEETR